jgi:hypothetical protein
LAVYAESHNGELAKELLRALTQMGWTALRKNDGTETLRRVLAEKWREPGSVQSAEWWREPFGGKVDFESITRDEWDHRKPGEGLKVVKSLVDKINNGVAISGAEARTVAQAYCAIAAQLGGERYTP